jgi:hypothetical protein
MPQFGHVVNLFSMCYDKGSKIVGMIEDRLGEAAFFDFMRIVYSKYFFRILRVADFQRELEEYTGQSWEQFFHDWLYGGGITDWAIEDVKLEPLNPPKTRRLCPWRRNKDQGTRATVILHQKADYNEPTVVGFCMNENGTSYSVRVPVIPQAEHLDIEDPPATMDTLHGNRVKIVVELPAEPKQIAVDPDQVLIDRDPSNNYWKCWYHWRVTPLYTFLDETDLTNDYDKWNFIFGPWLYLPPAYHDPWFDRTSMFGVRANAYRTQEFDGGAFAAYRYDYRDVVVGVDGLWDHFPWPHTQIGFTLEHRLESVFKNSDEHANRADLFGRYVFAYNSSLYLPPIHYVEVFGTVQNNFLPMPNQQPAFAERYDGLAMGGMHYHIDYRTPYWDPEAGFALDTTYGGGGVRLGSDVMRLDREQSLQELSGQFSTVKGLPDWLGPLSETRLAARIYGAAALPTKVEFFPLGGQDLFRGYTIAERQGSLVWVGSLEWRVPVARGLTWDCIDHVVGLRNVYLAGFYDVGNAYVNGHPVGDIAQAFGGGLRVDVAWFSFIERTILRVDVAKTINDAAPVQVWLGIQHPF